MISALRRDTGHWPGWWMAGFRNCCLNRVILTDAQYAAQSKALNSQYAESRREKRTTPIFTSFFCSPKTDSRNR